MYGENREKRDRYIHRIHAMLCDTNLYSYMLLHSWYMWPSGSEPVVYSATNVHCMPWDISLLCIYIATKNTPSVDLQAIDFHHSSFLWNILHGITMHRKSGCVSYWLSGIYTWTKKVQGVHMLYSYSYPDKPHTGLQVHSNVTCSSYTKQQTHTCL